MIHRDLPAEPEALRRRIHSGEVFLRASTDATERLVADVVRLLEAVFGPAPQEPAVAAHPEFWTRMVGLRRYLAGDRRFLDHARTLALALGFVPARTVLTPFRLRAILHRGHELPVNASAYVVHRDTWYGHPFSSVTAWIPLFDAGAGETFMFFPKYFDLPLFPNDSEGFEYRSGAAIAQDRLVADRHQREDRVIQAPEAETGLDLGPPLGFAAARGEQLLFSGAHLHSTQRSTSGRTRFSIDCRFVALDDHEQGLGAPNADTRCIGSAIDDYLPGEG